MKISFKLGIINVFMLLTLLIGSALTLNFYLGASSTIRDFGSQYSRTLTEKIVERSDSFLRLPAQQVQAIAPLIQGDRLLAERETYWQLMWDQLQLLPYCDNLYLGDEQGNFLQVRRRPRPTTWYLDRHADAKKAVHFYRDSQYRILEQVEEPTDYDPRKRPWYRIADAKAGLRWTPAYVFTSQRTLGLSAAYPLLSKEGRKLGVMAVDIGLPELSEFLKHQRPTANAVTYIVNPAGELIAYSDPSQVILEDDFGGLRQRHIEELPDPWIAALHAEHMAQGREDLEHEHLGERYFSRLVSFPGDIGQNWQVGVIIPADDLLGPAQAMLHRGVLITLGAMVLALLVIYLVAGRVSKPIISMARQMEDIRQFKLDAIHPVPSVFKEVAIMSDSLMRATRGLQSFRKFVPAELVQRLIKSGEEAGLSGKREELTLFFSDIAGFTGLSEMLSPDDLMQQLSLYLDRLSQIIMEEQGTIDKYIGDSIMAFWGAPDPVEQHAQAACRAALRCQQALWELNQAWLAEGRPPLETRIGIHSGEVVVGNMGSSNRLNYTVIGDSVNLASRLEGVNRFYATNIIISESVFAKLDGHFHCRLLGRVKVKGKRRGVDIYELLGFASEPLSEEILHLKREYEAALAEYWRRDWNQAEERLLRLQQLWPGDASISLVLENCRRLQAQPELAGDAWEGAFAFDSK
ncbi:MAG: hypothetical protein HQL47_09480 [Gammaproteobacteria bacterium]|nr:hypothetical protein [Gammaproteobacteria bacterium]